jgi:hypothetical protein
MDFDKETMQSLMIDHIDGKITGELAKYVEMHIEKHPEAKLEYEELRKVMHLMTLSEELDVPEHGKAFFMQETQKEIRGQNRSFSEKFFRIEAPVFWKVAAVVALVVAAYFGQSWLNKRAELDSLQSELRQTKELILISLMKQGSASERLKGIFASQEFKTVDDDIIDALVFAMNNDGNINVRIAAVDALANFSDNEKARAALIASLNNQAFPAVQLKLIDVLVTLGDKNALDPMKKISGNEENIKSVRDEAQMGIFKLM